MKVVLTKWCCCYYCHFKASSHWTWSSNCKRIWRAKPDLVAIFYIYIIIWSKHHYCPCELNKTCFRIDTSR